MSGPISHSVFIHTEAEEAEAEAEAETEAEPQASINRTVKTQCAQQISSLRNTSI